MDSTLREAGILSWLKETPMLTVSNIPAPFSLGLPHPVDEVFEDRALLPPDRKGEIKKLGKEANKRMN